ncbi:MAG: lipid kinase [Burkholderiales bacterium]|nr:lipid kinase [Phycisphaerae bacterium]
MLTRALVIANRNSRQCSELRGPACAALRERGFELTIPELPHRERIRGIIIELAATHDLVIAIGGDGTINATLPGVLETGLPLAILPAGTANDLARTLGLPADMPGAIEVIARGNTRPIDVAEVNGVPFVNAASLGMSVDITRQLDKPFKKRWGRLAYVLAATRSLFHMRAFTATIESDGQSTKLRSVQTVVGNGRYFGTGMTVDASAEIDDALLHLYAVKAVPWWRMLTLLPTLRAGTHEKSPAVVNITSDDLTIRTHRPKTISADGEILTKTPARFIVRARAIHVFA